MKRSVHRRSLVAAVLAAAACSSGPADTDLDAGAGAGVGANPANTVPVDTIPVDTIPVDTIPVDTRDDSTAEAAGPVGDPSEDKEIVTRAPGANETVLPEGYGSVSARITSAEGDECEVCLWLADDDTARQRGLMGVTDLGAAVGMAFRWDEPRTGNFFMFQTPTPLSIAWFDAGGSHVGQADMEPCLVDDSATCERYTAASPYVLAVEMFGGQLERIGIGPGATIEILELPCA